MFCGMTVRSFRDVAKLWPSVSDFASEMGVGVDTARKWSQRDKIPSEYWRSLLETRPARDAGLTAEVLTSLAARDEART